MLNNAVIGGYRGYPSLGSKGIKPLKVQKYLFKLVFSFSSEKDSEVELLDCMVVPFLVF